MDEQGWVSVQNDWISPTTTIAGVVIPIDISTCAKANLDESD